MYLSKSRKNYYKVIKSVRIDGKVKKEVLKYIGVLSPQEYINLKAIISSTTEECLEATIIDFNNSKLNLRPYENKVTLQAVRDNVYKKNIDKSWLKRAYLKDQMTIGSLAQVLGVSKDRIREHLDEIGIDSKMRLEIKNQRISHNHSAFGHHLVNGIQEKNPIESKTIEDMIFWRSEGLSYEKIAVRLTNNGIQSHSGLKKWDRGTVRRIILRNVSKISE